jgi:hypothetical protein
MSERAWMGFADTVNNVPIPQKGVIFLTLKTLCFIEFVTNDIVTS